MKRRTVVGSVGAAALGVVGVSAYTSATVARAASLTVENDDNAVLELTDGVGATLTGGTLELDGDGDNINRDATFEYGDTSDPSATPAFTITNGDGQSQDITISLSKSSSAGHALTLKTKLEGNSSVDNVGEGGTQTYSVPSSDSVYVAFELVTADDNTNYDGTLDLSASPTP